MPAKDWTTLYKWQWFARDLWRPGFRQSKRGRFGGSCACVADIATELGPDARVLDASCGFGPKTVVIAEMGVNVSGSDGCEFAVEKARELARLEGHDIRYFASTWTELARSTSERFDIIFIDALSWIETHEEFESSLAGILGALSPGGALVFMGAPEGAPDSSEHRAKLLDDAAARHPRFEVEWTHEAAGTRCTSLAYRERGAGWIDEHHVFIVQESGSSRLETATIRQPVCWGWPTLVEMFSHAGFASLSTREFSGRAADGGPVRLNVATK